MIGTRLLTMVMMMMMMKRFETRIECVCGLAGRYCRCVAPPVPWEGEVVVDGDDDDDDEKI